MALVKRISRLFKADFHAVLDRIEEPEQLLKQAIRDMQDELAGAEQRIRIAAHEQASIGARKAELEEKLAEIEAELDLCFAAKKQDLARSLVRKKLEGQRFLKRLKTQHAANERSLDQTRKEHDANPPSLAGSRQKDALFVPRSPPDKDVETQDAAAEVANLTVSDDEIDVAFLREQQARSAS